MTTGMQEAQEVVPARADARPRTRRLLAPVATGAVVVAGLAYLANVDPNEPGHYPLCPTRALFGIDCPGCGLMRATYALLHGDVTTACDHNVLVIPILIAAIAGWAIWMRRAFTGRVRAMSPRAARAQAVAAVAVTAFLIAFGIARNVVPYLGSGLSG